MRPVPMLCLAACSAALLLGSSGCADNQPTSSIGPGTDPAASISASPSQPATVHVGDTVVVRTTISGQVSWTIRDTAVLRQLSGGTVVAKGVGKSYVVAAGAKRRNAGQRDSSLITVDSITAPTDTTGTDTTSSTTTPTVHAGYYVAPTGSSGGDGSASHPWDLATALAGASGRVHPGDTVWVRGGTYKGEFRNSNNGTASAPIIFRTYPGERATIDGELVIYGSYTAFWGLEIMQSSPYTHGLNVRAPGTKLINLVVHDAGRNGIGFWVEAPNSELTGSLIYNNGALGVPSHGLYAMNRDGMKYITDNVLFDNEGYGIHVYGESGQYIQNFVIDGNVSFNNGLIINNPKSNLFVGGKSIVASGITLTNNTLLFSTSVSASNLRLGYDTTTNRDVVARGNYVMGGSPALEMHQWSSITMAADTFYSTGRAITLTTRSGWTGAGQPWGGNLWDRDPAATAWAFNGASKTLSGWKAATGLGGTDQATTAAPSGVRVVVRPNKYERGRANVIVNNWARQSAVAVDLSRVLSIGDRYEVHSVQNFFGAPVTSGTYGGGSISIPMGSIRPPTPIGYPSATPPVTSPAFDVFVVTRAGN